MTALDGGWMCTNSFIESESLNPHAPAPDPRCGDARAGGSRDWREHDLEGK